MQYNAIQYNTAQHSTAQRNATQRNATHWTHLSGSKCDYLDFILFLFFCFLHTLLPLSGNSGRLTRVRLQQPQEQRYPVLQEHAGSFRVSVIHRTQTWTKGPFGFHVNSSSQLSVDFKTSCPADFIIIKGAVLPEKWSTSLFCFYMQN